MNRLDETDIAPISFTCPFLESADSVTVVSQNFVSKNLIGGDMAAVPMAVEAEDLVFGGLEETSNGKQFVLSIRKEHLEPGAQEFRCEYGAGDQILGSYWKYKRKFVASFGEIMHENISLINGKFLFDYEVQHR